MNTQVPAKGRIATWHACWLIAVFAVLVGCSGITLISDYDAVTDQSLTALQTKTDDFITTLAKVTSKDSGEGAFVRHQAFYEDIDRDLRQLEFRVQSIPKNQHTIELVGNIRRVVLGTPNVAGMPETECTSDGTSLKDLHCLPENRAKGPSVKTLEAARRNIDQAISAALSLEVAKKQGLGQNK